MAVIEIYMYDYEEVRCGFYKSEKNKEIYLQDKACTYSRNMPRSIPEIRQTVRMHRLLS